MSDETDRAVLSEGDVDELVVREAGDDDAWEEPVRVRARAPTSFSLPTELAARASFLARLHHAPGLGEWLVRVIRERVEIEEHAFADAKRELAGRRSG